jgi:hypothetical protein
MVAALDLLEPSAAPEGQDARSTLASSLHQQLDILPRPDSWAHLKSGRVDREGLAVDPKFPARVANRHSANGIGGHQYPEPAPPEPTTGSVDGSVRQ